MNLELTDDGEYALSLSGAERRFLVRSLITAQTHTGDAEYEIATGHAKDDDEDYLKIWRLTGDKAGGYVLTLAQSELNFVLVSLRLCVTHVSSAEYEIVIGARQADSAEQLSDLEDQAEQAFRERIRRELDSKDFWRILRKLMGDLELLGDGVLAERLAKEIAQEGVAIDRKERQRAIVQRFKIDALLAELERRRQ